MSLTARSTTLGPVDLKRFRLLQVLRAVFACILVIFVSRTSDPGTSAVWLCGAASCGIFHAGRWLKRGRTLRWALIAHAVLFGAVLSVLWVAENFTASSGAPKSQDFLAFRYGSHIRLILLSYALAFWGSWFFWCSRLALTLELLVLSTGFVWILSGHRNYHLDAPKNISSLAWQIGERIQRDLPAFQDHFTVAPQHLLIALACGFALLLGWYLLLASTRPLFRGQTALKSSGPAQRAVLFATPLAMLALLIGYGVFVNQRYSENLSRATEGVGQESKEGKSPLGFHSAIGKTKQPAALVRLEGDYARNPWSPMLYFREGALSDFDGRELVIADKRFDNDVPRITPGQPYISLVTPSAQDENRQEVVQSIFLLTKHNAPFAIDFPYSLRTLKNPEPERFELAYQAVSLAPVINLEQLIGEEVGDPSWSQATWDHYLRAPGSRTKDPLPPNFNPEQSEALPDANGEDLRYRAMLAQIVPADRAPVEKAALISQYLSDKSIYTRNPGHQATETGDPVAPYLFQAEKRGYCVHFSHAGAYLMRLAGIPARIATGYLTDTRYAKDGHILLHLGDRHAWPEIYVRGIGWVVLDVTPSRAENEQEIVPDEKLLEELMSKLDPAEELITPPPLDSPEESLTESIIDSVAEARLGWISVLLALVYFTLRKFWIRFAFKVFPAGPLKTRLAYIACTSLLADLGITRVFGETRREFRSRLETWGLNLHRITEFNELVSYKGAGNVPAAEEISAAVNEFDRSFDASRSVWRRVIGFFSPLTMFRFRLW